MSKIDQSIAESASLPPAAQLPTTTALQRTASIDLRGVAELHDLVRVVAEALLMVPPNYIASLLGPASSWLRDRRRLSELDLLDVWRLRRAITYLFDITTPSIAGRPEDWLRRLLPTPLREQIWNATEFFRQDDPFGNPSSHRDERWLFINGIATNRAVATLNAELISKLFWRPVTVIHNATNSLALDLYECAVGKALRTRPVYDADDSTRRATFTEPALQATIALLAALNDRSLSKVVLIAHSQGTIIAANVLRAIEAAIRQSVVGRRGPRIADLLVPEKVADDRPHVRSELATALDRLVTGDGAQRRQKLQKLEVYTFANCANWMRWPELSGVEPHLEHFANRNDLVARLGVLSPLRDDAQGPIDIDGPIFERDAWGHLLNAHYLLPIGDHLRNPRDVPNPYPRLVAGQDEDAATPRLYGYYEGGNPEGP